MQVKKLKRHGGTTTIKKDLHLTKLALWRPISMREITGKRAATFWGKFIGTTSKLSTIGR
jgi:hypothetical protein